MNSSRHHLTAWREEMADVLEVLTTMAITSGLDWSSVLQEGDKKRAERGSFAERLWLATQPNDQ